MFSRSGEIVRWAAVVLLALAVGRPGRSSGQEGPAKPAAEPKAGQPSVLMARFGLPDVHPDVLQAFKALRAEVRELKQLKGRIDWSARKIVALGRSIQVGNRPADILMAKRAAGVIALRNALAVAVGVPIGINGRVDGLKDGKIILQGFLRGFQVTKAYSEKRAGQVTWVAEAHVPMFGFKSIGGRFYNVQLAAHRALVVGWQRARWALPAKPEEAAGDLLVIDARGTGFRPSMYPVFVNDRGRILLDMVTAGRQVSINHGLCSYATTEVKFEKLQSGGPLPSDFRRVDLAVGVGVPWQNVDGVRWDRLLLARAVAAGERGGDRPTAKAKPATGPTSAPATRPATRPTTRPSKPPTVFRRRRPRRYAVRATRSKGKRKAVLVIASKEALKMLGNPRASHLARNGRVLVVVDAAAAGVEGLLPPGRWQRGEGVEIAARAR